MGLMEELRAEILNDREKAYFDGSKTRYELLANYFQNKEKSMILDLGCSPGHGTMLLTRLGNKVVGVDLNKIYIKKYNPDWLGTFSLLIADMEESFLPFKDESFDHVIFTEVLEHIAIRRPEEIFREIRRVLKPTGTLYLTTPNIANWSNVLALVKNKNIFWSTDIFYGGVDRHNREWTSEELWALLSNSGFLNIRISFYNTISNWSAHLSSRWQKITKLRVPQIRILNNTILAIATKSRSIEPLNSTHHKFYWGSHFSILNINLHRRVLHQHYAAKILFNKSEFGGQRVRLIVQNIGKRTWTRQTNLRIGTSTERDRISALYHPRWISRNRVCTFSEQMVQPGEIATFDFEIMPSGQTEDFELVVEGKLWLPSTKFQIPDY